MDNPAESDTATASARPLRNPGGRDDCWSEGATAVLIEAWGERHLRCNRGNLRQDDWREVADAVNGRDFGAKPRKSDVQCKNRIDTLKKKYKLEKAKSPPSTWPFFSPLDHLIGSGTGSNKSGSPASTANCTPKQRSSRFRSNPNNSRPGAIAALSGGSSSSRLNSVDSTDSESSLKSDRKRSSLKDCPDSPPEEIAFRELARALFKFGEIYERIECSKQRQIVELERQRMEFTKELEFQRMNMLMEAQLEIEKVKRSKNASNSGGTSNKL